MRSLSLPVVGTGCHQQLAVKRRSCTASWPHPVQWASQSRIKDISSRTACHEGIEPMLHSLQHDNLQHQHSGISTRRTEHADDTWHARSTTDSLAQARQMEPGAVLLLAGGVMSLALAAPADAAGLTDILEGVKAYAGGTGGPAGIAAFIAAYVACCVLFVPGSLLTLAAGAIYGPVTGTAVVSAASTLGALAAFSIARTAARPWVEERVQGSPQVKAVLSGVSAQGYKLVLLLRLSPLVPFTLLNYALGLTEVSAVEYTIASWAGMLPATAVYVYLGWAGAAALSSVGDASGPEPAKLLLWGIGAVASLLATKLISDAASKALKEVPPTE